MYPSVFGEFVMFVSMAAISITMFLRIFYIYNIEIYHIMANVCKITDKIIIMTFEAVKFVPQVRNLSSHNNI